ncbi:MAG: metallophosphoesterase, partial [Alphaproteobacteria bacterium]
PWVVLGPDGPVVRTATAEAACPRIRYDDFDRPMQVRVGPWPAFPVTVCEAPLPAIVREVRFAGTPVPVPAAEPRRVIVFGDTGCRVKDGAAQDCTDPAAWPFARIAASAAALKPDLVIHVGDYLYREAPCPPGNAGCTGGPHGDRYDTWRADFFDPAKPLLAAAPWVVVRGNHEDCRRAGHGWFRFLDPRPRAPDCEGFTDPYRVALGGLELVVMDNVYAPNDVGPPDLVERYRRQIEQARRLAGSQAWLLAHLPHYGIYLMQGDGAAQRPIETSKTMITAAAPLGPDPFRFVFSGHIHRFDAISFDGGQPAQVIVGTGGTRLDRERIAPIDPAATITVAGARVVPPLTSEIRPGFLLLEREGADWTASFRDPDGALAFPCRLAGKTFACMP